MRSRMKRYTTSCSFRQILGILNARGDTSVHHKAINQKYHSICWPRCAPCGWWIPHPLIEQLPHQLLFAMRSCFFCTFGVLSITFLLVPKYMNTASNKSQQGTGFHFYPMGSHVVLCNHQNLKGPIMAPTGLHAPKNISNLKAAPKRTSTGFWNYQPPHVIKYGQQTFNHWRILRIMLFHSSVSFW